MGRLSEYVNGNRGRSTYLNTGATSKNGVVEVFGFEDNAKMLGKLLTNDPTFADYFKKYIRIVLREARNKLTKDARDYMESDPRKASLAVRYAIMKEYFGGELDILYKKPGTAGAKYRLIRKRKLDENPHQRGGNRRPRIDDGRNRLDYYYGVDRQYILRFLGSGTVKRQSRFGNRGSIRRTNWFGHTAPWHMNTAVEKVAEALNEYIKQQTNGKK